MFARLWFFRRMFMTRALGFAVAAIMGIATPVAARPAPDSFADLVQALQPTVVNISTTTQVEVGRSVQMFPGMPPGHPLEDLFKNRGRDGQAAPENGGKPATREAQSLGSGFVIDAGGYVVTNNHVITGDDQNTVVDKITVTLTDGRKFDAKLVGRDAPSDLALLKIEPRGAPLNAARFGDSGKSRVGDWVLAIGQPFGLGGTVTAGIVSAIHRDVQGGQYPFFIQTDAPINRGNSGGPMFNSIGEVVGINSAIYSPSGGSVGIGFAIPSSYASDIISQLRSSGKVRRSWLGVNIQTLDEDLANASGIKSDEGVVVANVNSGTPAAKAGIKPGDIITAFQGKPIKRSSELSYAVSTTAIGTKAVLDVVRNAKPQRVEVVLEELPGGDPNLVGQPSEPQPKKDTSKDAGKAARQGLGINLTPLTPELRRRLNMEAKDPGVVITGVAENSDAARKNLSPGDVLVEVDRVEVSSPEEAAKAVDAARKVGKTTVLLRIRKDGSYFFVGVKLQPVGG
jgi:serine protease Do